MIAGLALACAVLAWAIIAAAPASAAKRYHHHRQHVAKHRHHAPGNASVYGIGDGNCGSMTASGERFDCKALTAAHKTMRLGSIVSVCHQKTQKCVTVRINDRGPYIFGREVDLSPLAARVISCDGVCDVSIHLISEPDHDIRIASNAHPQRSKRHRHHIAVAGAGRHRRADQCVLPRGSQAVRSAEKRRNERVAEGAGYCVYAPPSRANI